MTLENLREILKKLVDGDVEKIADQTIRSKAAVYQVFRKESFVQAVLENALNLIEQNAYDNLKFVTKKRAELKESVKVYEAKKRRQLEKRLERQQAA